MWRCKVPAILPVRSWAWGFIEFSALIVIVIVPGFGTWNVAPTSLAGDCQTTPPVQTTGRKAYQGSVTDVRS